MTYAMDYAITLKLSHNAMSLNGFKLAEENVYLSGHV
jgi:hypothetical protein